jgi:hypothetical protein
VRADLRAEGRVGVRQPEGRVLDEGPEGGGAQAQVQTLILILLDDWTVVSGRMVGRMGSEGKVLRDLQSERILSYSYNL